MIFWPIEMQKKDEERMAQEKKVKVLEDAKKQQEEGRLLGRIKIYIKYYTYIIQYELVHFTLHKNRGMIFWQSLQTFI